jgi:hypothetical protein
MIQIAIPSYQRPTVLATQTLATLEQENVPKDIITIFVASQEESNLYKQTCSEYKIVIGVPGLVQQRNFITKYYPQGTHLISLDDDIKKFKSLSPRPFLQIAKRMFELCQHELCSLWGIYPVNNLFFCKERIIKSVSFIIGHCYGYIVSHERVIPDEVIAKDDKWFSLWHARKDGYSLRYEGMCADTAMYKPGGLTDTRKKVNEDTCVEFVARQFPELCESRKKKNGQLDVYIRGKILKKFSIDIQDDSGESLSTAD